MKSRAKNSQQNIVEVHFVYFIYKNNQWDSYTMGSLLHSKFNVPKKTRHQTNNNQMYNIYG